MEIVSDVALVTQGDKVGGSEATLLAKLGIKPFSYGLIIQKVLTRGPACSLHPVAATSLHATCHARQSHGWFFPLGGCLGGLLWCARLAVT